MSVDKIRPFNDPRISLRSAHLNGHTYGYLHSLPPQGTKQVDTIILIHGFPDISFGWRYQIPLLASLGLEVIALDCLGYGRSDSPPTTHLSAYTFKRIANDIATLCDQLNLTSIILGGHDWGGAIVYRVQQYHPTLIKAFFSICTPYAAPSRTYTPLAILTQKAIPNFRYQLQFASGAVETAVQSPSEIRQFLHGLYGARTADSERLPGFDAERGALLSNLPRMSKTKLLSSDEMEYYVTEYARHGINGPLNWYRTRELNYLDDLDLFFDGNPTTSDSPGGNGDDEEKIKIKNCEVLFLQADKDAALKPFLARKMDERIESLTWKHVDAGHWALWERSSECNAVIEGWLKEKVLGKDGGVGKKSKL